MMVRFQLSLVALLVLVQIAQAAPDEVAELDFRIANYTSSASLVDVSVDIAQSLKDIENSRKIDLVIRLVGCINHPDFHIPASNALFHAFDRLDLTQQKLDLAKTHSTQAVQLMAEANTAFQANFLALASSKTDAAIPKIEAAHSALNEAIPLYELAVGDLYLCEALIDLCEMHKLLFPE